MSLFRYKPYYQRHLPHYQPPGASFFITFRLAGSLPEEAIQRLEAETRALEREIDLVSDENNRKAAAYQAQKHLFASWDSELDKSNHSPRWLAEPAVAQMVSESLQFRDGKSYTLEAFCLMPNHVHLVCTPLQVEEGYQSLARIMQSLKGFTARQANLLLDREGEFWQHESYDHVVRDDQELARIIQYVVDNPTRVGLPGRWVYCRV